MRDIVIFGAGGFGKEIQWLIERLNQKNSMWNILGYIDDGVEIGTELDDKVVLGDTAWLQKRTEPVAVAVAIGNAVVRAKVVEKLRKNQNLQFPNLIDPSVICSNRIEMGVGNLICAGTIMTVDIKVGSFNILNLDCTVGHDVRMADFITAYPSVNISGNTKIGDCVELGTGVQIIQGKHVCAHAITGAGSVIIRDIEESGTYVGAPAKKIK